MNKLMRLLNLKEVSFDRIKDLLLSFKNIVMILKNEKLKPNYTY